MGNSPSKKFDKSSGSSPSSEFGTGGNSEVNTPRSSNSPFEQPNQPSSDYNHNNITSSESHSNLNSSPAQPQPQSTTNLGSPNSKEGITVDKNNSNDSNHSTEVDVDDVLSRLLEIGHSGRVPKTLEIEKGEIQALCQLAREILLSQPSLIELSAPVKVVGDIHGQYPDLIRMFDMCGYPPSSNFLFLGDYVDRGQQSIETMLLLLCFKIKYPENFFLLRGNHECANVTRVYGFYDECKRRASVKVWKSFVSVFNCLPLASVIANKIFCIHGGLSPSLNTMDDIRKIVRPSEIPDYGLLNDLLWSDPSETTQEWEDNDRGVSYCFGKAVVDDFLARQEFDLVCRAHMVVEDGYEFFNGRTLVTIFSAPNYCGEFDNYGAVMAVNEELLCSFELLKPIENKLLSSEPQPQLSLPFYDTEADP